MCAHALKSLYLFSSGCARTLERFGFLYDDIFDCHTGESLFLFVGQPCLTGHLVPEVFPGFNIYTASCVSPSKMLLLSVHGL